MRYKLVRTKELSLLRDENKQLKKTIENAVSYVKALEEGNYVRKFDGDNPIYNSLESLADSLSRIGEEEKQRAWQAEGFTLFMGLLKNDTNNLSSLSENVISNLVKYVGANQGGFFVVEKRENGETTLRLTGCYAYGRKKIIEKEIDAGQGLLGQVYLEKTSLYMTEVPRNYTTITSGLGEATPRSILIVPLKDKGEVKALVELASFDPFLPYQIQFIERLGENIAAVIEANAVNMRTEQLLKASQQHAEELKAQEEEMRQNMEELTAMHENQTRLQKELNTRVQELETAKKQIETFKEAEAVKMKRQNEVQSKIMNAALEKFKKREAELLDRISSQDEELALLKRSFLMRPMENTKVTSA